METRVAVLAIIVRDTASVPALNELLHQYAPYIIGRMGVPYHEMCIRDRYDGIEYRGFGQEIVEELANYAGVPVFNGLTNEFHPTQILADFLTIQEHFGRLKGIKLVYLGCLLYTSRCV